MAARPGAATTGRIAGRQRVRGEPVRSPVVAQAKTHKKLTGIGLERKKAEPAAEPKAEEAEPAAEGSIRV